MVEVEGNFHVRQNSVMKLERGRMRGRMDKEMVRDQLDINKVNKLRCKT